MTDIHTWSQQLPNTSISTEISISWKNFQLTENLAKKKSIRYHMIIDSDNTIQ